MIDLLEQLARGMRTPDEADGRVYGFLSGVITSTNDPKSLGRVKARVGAQADSEETEWLVPLWPGAMEGIPNSKEAVVVGFLDGDPHRGFYAWHPLSTTQNRASDMAILGSTFIAMYNDLAQKFAQLTQLYNTHQHTAPTGGGPTTGNTGPYTAGDPGKGQNADGSPVAPSSGDKAVLSGRAKVGK